MARQENTFETFIARERERLTRARDEAFQRRREIDQEVEAIERELRAMTAYDLAKKGKLNTREQGKPRQALRQRAPRGEKRDRLLALIRNAPRGLGRGEILQQLGVKGDKSSEQSVSNALSALKKQGQLESREGKYIAA